MQFNPFSVAYLFIIITFYFVQKELEYTGLVVPSIRYPPACDTRASGKRIRKSKVETGEIMRNFETLSIRVRNLFKMYLTISIFTTAIY